MQISGKREAGFDAADVVASLYRALNREPDVTGLDGLVKAVREHGLDDVVRTFPGSVEYQLIARPGPFWNYAATFDPVATIRAHENRARKAVPNHRVNFFGVAVNVDRFAPQLKLENIVEPPPISGQLARRHGRIWRGLAGGRACGRYLHDGRTGLRVGLQLTSPQPLRASRARNRSLLAWRGMKDTLSFRASPWETNWIPTAQYKLLRGVAAAKQGTAFFPKQDRAGSMWGLAPVFAASPAQIKTLRKDKNYAELKMISLPEVVADHPRLDLLHIDIQGGETNLIRDSIDILNTSGLYRCRHPFAGHRRRDHRYS